MPDFPCRLDRRLKDLIACRVNFTGNESYIFLFSSNCWVEIVEKETKVAMVAYFNYCRTQMRFLKSGSVALSDPENV